ncbi:MAG: aminotransferase class I/II-fold pyridoxal phosphate-dependent enzyme [Oscillospiraceae bacterium]|nr:aminotransferase class I/II-fold pyridoxal phosphate-dependent enzyme [Oscillospiraceae bacterium]
MDYSKVLSERASGIKPSGIRRFFDLMENAPDTISLGIGEPDFVTPWHIRDAGIASLEKGYTYYTPNAGTTELRGAISAYMKRSLGLEYAIKDEIVVTVGGSEAIDLALRAVVNPGDEVIVPEPSFVCYGPMASLAGGVPVFISTKPEDKFKLTPKDLEAAITSKTKAIILPYPNNPTGAILEKEELEALAEVIKKHDIIVISDEIYSELTYDGKHISIASINGMRERTIVVNGFSKSYAMTGWRLGYACGPREIISIMTRVHQYAIMSAPTTAQFAAVEALNHGDGDIEEMREEYDRRRRFMCDRFNNIGLSCEIPHGAFYMFPSIKSTGLTSEEFCMRLLREKHVAVIPGNAFGESGEGFVRCCYAASMKNIAKALTRIEEFIESL